MEEKYMKIALKEAKKAYNKDEIPVGAVIIKNGEVVAKAYNLKETKQDTTNHVTLEPCSMCAGALIQSRIKKVYIGAMDYKTGACGSILNLLEDYPCNHKVEVQTGVMQEECEQIIKNFFKELREKKKQI